MASRLAALLPRFIVLAIIGLLATATFTFAAEKQIVSTPIAKPPPAAPPVLVVPDVQRQAYVFAKGILQDAGFAWQVEGPVHGFAANTVALQRPTPGTRVRDTGAPLVVLHLVANPQYVQHGLPEDTSPYRGTAIRLVDAPVKRVAQKRVVQKQAAKKHVTKKRVASARPPAFVVLGARKEPLDEIPLTERARRLRAWLGRHPQPTNANVSYWLFQNSWIVTGARFGWWHGAEALRLLVAANVRAQHVWGIGLKSEARARAALAYVRAKSR